MLKCFSIANQGKKNNCHLTKFITFQKDTRDLKFVISSLTKGNIIALKVEHDINVTNKILKS